MTRILVLMVWLALLSLTAVEVLLAYIHTQPQKMLGILLLFGILPDSIRLAEFHK